MSATNIRSGITSPTAAPTTEEIEAVSGPPASGVVEIPDQAAREAAQEVAEATETFAPEGMAAEPVGQAQAIAESDLAEAAGESGEGDDELNPRVRREVGRSVFKLAWPAIGENALQTLMGIVDTAVVARLGTAALSGVGASQQLIWMLTTALIAVSMGTTVLVARHTGGGEHTRANTVLKQSLIMAVIVGLFLIPIGFLSLPMLNLLGLDPQAAQEGAIYLQITLQMSLLIVIMFVAGAALRGAGDTRTPMAVTGFINVINAFLAVELVFGGPKASQVLSDWLSSLTGAQVTIPTFDWIPAMGVAGSAWASVIARGIGSVLLLSVFLLPRARLSLLGAGSWKPNFDTMWRVLKIGIPSAVEQLLMSVGILIYSLIVIGLGEVVFATSRLALNVIFISQMPGLGFAIAATTLVGQSLGAKQPRRARFGAFVSTRSALIWMSVMGVVFWFFGRELLTVFTDDPRLLDLGATCLKVIAFNQPPLALAFVLAGALRGAGDVRFPMWATNIAVWFVRLPIGVFLGLSTIAIPFTSLHLPGLGLGLPGIYGALIVEATVRAGMMLVRFRSGKWQAMKV